ncbi:MAG: trimethylamine methyltransferase family protein [Alphaproteobacteria bacterium]
MTRQRKETRRRRRDAVSEIPPPPAYLTRAVPPYEFLSEDGLQRIEDQADRLLAEIGIEFRDDPASLDYVRDAGADVQGERVRFPPGMCRELIQRSAPRQFAQLARNPERSVMIGGDAQVFSPVYGAPFIRGLDIERRYATLEDFNTLVKLCQITPNLHHSGGTICEPTDVPVSKRHLDMTYGHIRYSDKAYMGAATSSWQAEDSIRMTEMVFGADVVDGNCCVLAMINPTSPLVYDGVTLETLRLYAAHNQGNVVTPFIIAGASGPVTPASMVAQLFAEAMAGMALAQLVRPGSPVIFGINSMGLNMRTGSPMRFDESWKCLLAAGQLSRRLGVPYRCGGASSTAKIPDAHAGMESALYLNYSILSGVNFLIHATGALELGLCVSYEKFVLDCEMLGVVSRVMAGMDVSDAALAVDAYTETGPGGNFLANAHTLERYRDAFFESDIFDSRSFEQWRDDGEHDAASRANKTLNSMLTFYEAPPLDAAIDDALLDFMARRKAELPDSYA